MLPTYRNEEIEAALPPKEVTKVALRLKYLVEEVIPCELEEASISNPNSAIITKNVVRAARNAAGGENKACVVFCLLVCIRWFKIQAMVELWDAELHDLRVIACEIIAKRMYEYLSEGALIYTRS